MSKSIIDPEIIEYLAFEGGGGKGVVYVSILHFFEAAGLLPYKGQLSDKTQPCLKGISGTSSGSISTYMIALGMSADEIEKETERTVEGDKLNPPTTPPPIPSNGEERSIDEIENAITYLNFDPDPIEEIQPRKGKKRGTPFFSLFIDSQPIPLLYKSVIFKDGKNVPAYAVDKFRLSNTPLPAMLFKDALAADSYLTFEEAKRAAKNRFLTLKKLNDILLKGLGELTRAATQGTKAKELYNKFIHKPKTEIPDNEKAFGDLLAKYVTKYWEWSLLVIKLFNHNFLIRKLLKAGKVSAYLDSFVYGRGVSSGIFVRKYLRELTAEHLNKNFKDKVIEVMKAELTLETAGMMTFDEYQKITGLNLKIVATNITRQNTVTFCQENTPLMPVVETVCMSSSFPGVFKPTLFQGKVKEEKGDITEEYNKKYWGHYMDGGIINNIPIRTWDEAVKTTVIIDKVNVDLIEAYKSNPNVFATRLNDGPDVNLMKDNLPSKDKLWTQYQENKQTVFSKIFKPKKRIILGDEAKNYAYKIELFPYFQGKTILLDLAKNFWGTLSNYNLEQGQLNASDLHRSLVLNSWDITVLNFTPDLDLKHFAQAIALVRIAAKFGGEIKRPTTNLTDNYIKHNTYISRKANEANSLASLQTYEAFLQEKFVKLYVDSGIDETKEKISTLFDDYYLIIKDDPLI